MQGFRCLSRHGPSTRIAGIAAQTRVATSGTTPGNSKRSTGSSGTCPDRRDSSPSSYAVTTSPAAKRQVVDGGEGQTARSAARSGRPHTRHAATPGKTKRAVASARGAGGGGLGRDIKVRKRDPWGLQQLRDSWSEDAMTKRETENLSERIHREYRYHPDEQRRYYIKYTAFAVVPLLLLSWACSYYYYTGRPLWQADPQHLLNLLRVADTSPRSKLYLYRLEETNVLPEHVQRYRAAHKGERERAERIFKVTHSAFAKPTEDDLRRMELEDEEEEEEKDEEEEREGHGGAGPVSTGAAVVGGVAAPFATEGVVAAA